MAAALESINKVSFGRATCTTKVIPSPAPVIYGSTCFATRSLDGDRNIKLLCNNRILTFGCLPQSYLYLFHAAIHPRKYKKEPDHALQCEAKSGDQKAVFKTEGRLRTMLSIFREDSHRSWRHKHAAYK